jgi:DUF971 family protein
MAERIPTEIKLHQKSRVMEVAFADGHGFRLPYEYLRVYSPSAEVRGHGPGQEVLQTGKREVEIRALEAVGSYAVQPVFPMGTAPGSTLGSTFTSWAKTRDGCGASMSRGWRKPAPLAISRRLL